MNWLRRFMYGRYGFDALSNTLLVISLIMYIVFIIFNLNLLALIPLLILIYVYYRFFSKNIQKRYNENMKFKAMVKPITRFFSMQRKKFKDRKTHKYYKCPRCKQYLRVPKNKGKIKLSCPKCKNTFIKKT